MTTRAVRLFVTFAPAAALLAFIVVVCLYKEVPFGDVTKDVTAIAGLHPLIGALSNLGMLLWCATASVCLFASWMLWRMDQRAHQFLLASGLLTIYLLLDDLFLIHEDLVDRYLGVHEVFILAALAGAAGAWLYKFRDVIILRTDFRFLLVALGLLATSVFVDLIPERWMQQLGEWAYLAEDGFKWLGIAGWCGYHIHASHSLLVAAYGPLARAPGADAVAAFASAPARASPGLPGTGAWAPATLAQAAWGRVQGLSPARQPRGPTPKRRRNTRAK